MSQLDADIDAAILALADRRRKVARIVGEVGETIVDCRLNPNSNYYDYVAQRIAALVTDGRLIAFGDITNWRFSEVCAPDSVDASDPH